MDAFPEILFTITKHAKVTLSLYNTQVSGFHFYGIWIMDYGLEKS